MHHKGFHIKFNGYTYEYYSSEHDHGSWSDDLNDAIFNIDEYLESLKN